MTWDQRAEEAFVARLGEHSDRKLMTTEKIRRVEGYLFALETPRRWDHAVDVPKLKRVAMRRLDALRKLRAKELERIARTNSKQVRETIRSLSAPGGHA